MKRTERILRFVLPFLGAFLFGVLPGAEVVHGLYAQSRSYPGSGPPVVLFLLSCFGSFLGSYLYHLICHRELNGIDIAYAIVIASMCWVVMAVYMLLRYALPAGV
jgi:hypothetical protein